MAHNSICVAVLSLKYFSYILYFPVSYVLLLRYNSIAHQAKSSNSVLCVQVDLFTKCPFILNIYIIHFIGSKQTNLHTPIHIYGIYVYINLYIFHNKFNILHVAANVKHWNVDQSRVCHVCT